MKKREGIVCVFEISIIDTERFSRNTNSSSNLDINVSRIQEVFFFFHKYMDSFR